MGESASRSTATSDLLRRAKRGDRHALGSLLEHSRRELSELARQLLSAALAQKVGASDLVQETCLDAMRDFGAARVADAAQWEAWLRTLLTNNLKDWQRKFGAAQKRNLRRERPLHDHEAKRDLLQATLGHDSSSAESRAIQQEAASLLDLALRDLPRGYQQIIRWRTHERRSWQEIASRLDRSEDAARMLWKRAVERLKRQMRELP